MSIFTYPMIEALAQNAGLSSPLANIAAAIALAESGGNTNATHTNNDGSVDRGLWQINNRAHPDVSDSCAFDPVCSAKEMIAISHNGTNWTAWTTYNSGAYRQYQRGGQSYTSQQPSSPQNSNPSTASSVLLVVIGVSLLVTGIAVIAINPKDVANAGKLAAKLALA